MNTGHIRRIYIENLLQFEGAHTIDISSNECPSLVALIGSGGTGKTKMLECISHINILRYTYSRAESNRLERLDGSPAGETEPKLHDCLTKHSRRAVNIWKSIQDEISLFAVEAVGPNTKVNSCPIYYGLYAGEDEDHWYWDYQTVDGSYKYSALFVLDTSDNMLYILHPSKELSQEQWNHGLVRKYHLEGQEKVKSFETLKGTLENYLSSQMFGYERLDSLPKTMTHMLPSDFCSSELQRRMRKMLSDKTQHLMDTFFSEESTPAPCLLIENPVDNLTPESADRIFTKMTKNSKRHQQQIVMTAYQGSFSQNIRFTSVVRLWKSSPNTREAQQVPPEVFRNIENGPEWFAFMTANSVVLVEGRSDLNVMRGIKQEWEERARDQSKDLLFLLEHTYLCSVGGKAEFHTYVDKLLSFSLSVLFGIVCDGDALVGGKAKRFESNRKKDNKKLVDSFCLESHILKSKKSIFSQCLRHLLLHYPHVPTILKNVGDIPTLPDTLSKCKDEFQGLLKEQMNKIVEDLSKGIIAKNCDSYEKAKEFSMQFLRTFSWDKADLEAVINHHIAEPIAKSTLAKYPAAGVKIGEDLVKGGNAEVEKLLTFIKTQLLMNSRGVLKDTTKPLTRSSGQKNEAIKRKYASDSKFDTRASGAVSSIECPSYTPKDISDMDTNTELEPPDKSCMETDTDMDASPKRPRIDHSEMEILYTPLSCQNSDGNKP